MPLPSFLRLLLLAALWGGSFLLMRVAAPVLGALPTAFVRVLLGAAGLGLLLLVLRLRPRFGGKLGATLVLGVVNSGIPFLMFAMAARSLAGRRSTQHQPVARKPRANPRRRARRRS